MRVILSAISGAESEVRHRLPLLLAIKVPAALVLLHRLAAATCKVQEE